MKILIVRPIINQVKAIQSTGEDISLLIIRDKYNDKWVTDAAINKFSNLQIFDCNVPNYGIRNLIAHCIYIRSLINSHDFDLIHLNGLRDILVFYLCRLFASNKPKIVATSHNRWNATKVRLFMPFLKHLINGYVAISSKNKQQLIDLGFPPTRIHFIPNAFDENDSLLNMGRHKDSREIRIIYVATVDRRKSQITLIDAIGHLVKSHNNIRVLLVGAINDVDYHQELLSRINELGLENIVNFLGRIDHNDVLRQYQSADIVAFPSKGEMMPRAVIEAMWLGKPVIATAVDGILDLIQDRETGLLFQPGDSITLAKLIQELIENSELASRLAAAGQNHVRDLCSLGKVGSAYSEFYYSLLNRRQNKF